MMLVNVLNRAEIRSLHIAALSLIVSLLTTVVFAQGTEPQREQLLNGLRILLWTRPGDQSVVLKLRIHSGAVFDPAAKEGTMALLGDLFFPDPATHAYFTEEARDGRLDVETNYDSINITLKGRESDYDRIVDILRAALVTTPLTSEEVAKARANRIAQLRNTKRSAAEVADWAIAERLLGSFPYTHPISGTVESVGRIERADLMFVRERFLNPNNATLIIVGGVDERRAMRAVRQLLGGWRKSEQIIPATFRQPAPPDSRTLIINSSEAAQTEIRLATRGVARSDPDFPAASLLASIVKSRWQTLQPEPAKNAVFARLDGHSLPGMFVIGASVDSTAAAKTLDNARAVIKSLMETSISAVELLDAKTAFNSSGLSTRQDTAEALANSWLDIHTYGLPAISEQRRLSDALTAADLQRVAVRLFRNTPSASVAVGNSEQLKTLLAPTNQIVLLEDLAKPKAPEQKPTTDSAPGENPRRAPVFQIKRPNPMVKSTKPAEKP